jgi:two-component system, OmpR family, sensor histidine kinase SenX3
MTILPKSTIALVALIVLLILILAALATLQYLWSEQISEAVHERMQANLRASMDQFRQQYNNELLQLAMSLQPDPAGLTQRNWKSYAEICGASLRGSYGHLAGDIYLWVKGEEANPNLLHLNRRLDDFEPIEWPKKLESFRNRHTDSFLLDSPRPDRENRNLGWIMLYQSEILLKPLVEARTPSDAPGSQPRFIGFLIIELNRENMRSMLLPEIAQRIFQGSEGYIYHLAVVNIASGSIVYRSDPSLTMASFAQPDAKISLMLNPRDRMDFRGPGNRRMPPGQPADRPPMNSINNFPPPPRPGRGGPISIQADDGDWALVAKHREGSLDAAVASLRRRNLAISFGSLLLLAASMALIIASARRAQRLAGLQLEFVAGVSHELRTPLTVICSAGDNLADGIISDASQSAKYGELIRSEGRKLAGMIDRIMQFASLERGPRPINLRPVPMNEIAAEALKQAEHMIVAAGVSVERNFAAKLPPINADSAALIQVVQNLIENALKYSGDQKRLAIRTLEISEKHGSEIQLIVEDQGMGIDSEDLPHIFDPFYRGKAAISEQIHGAGLGLHLVRATLKSMNASISVRSAPGKGSQFIIHFSASPASSTAGPQDSKDGI